ncbi:UNVERIFIED_CONTAM: hypothetical protein Scaly_2542500 [Sesamum calycinum]|uniref:Uncharacterized protein n=1 Tax=Sesamum calycinum TaxID=2727403 RepID=A0AAW2JA70_9LAMI
MQGFGVDSHGRRGGLTLFWDKSVSCVLRSFSRHHIDVTVTVDDDTSPWCFTTFYGEPDISKRKYSWELLASLACQSPRAWLVCGDFNEILEQSENREAFIAQFGKCVNFGRPWIMQVYLIWVGLKVPLHVVTGKRLHIQLWNNWTELVGMAIGSSRFLTRREQIVAESWRSSAGVSAHDRFQHKLDGVRSRRTSRSLRKEFSFRLAEPLINDLESGVEALSCKVDSGMDSKLLKPYTADQITTAIQSFSHTAPLKSPGPDEAPSSLISRAELAGQRRGIQVLRAHYYPVSSILDADLGARREYRSIFGFRGCHRSSHNLLLFPLPPPTMAEYSAIFFDLFSKEMTGGVFGMRKYKTKSLFAWRLDDGRKMKSSLQSKLLLSLAAFSSFLDPHPSLIISPAVAEAWTARMLSNSLLIMASPELCLKWIVLPYTSNLPPSEIIFQPLNLLSTIFHSLFFLISA